MSSATFIYALCEPDTHAIRYVGKSDDPKRRHKAHIRRAKGEHCHRARWICSLAKDQKKPFLEVLDCVPSGEWQFWEREYIRLFRAIGFDLVNTTAGGEGTNGVIPSPETIAKVVAKTRGQKRTAETRALLSEQKRGARNPRFGKRPHNFGKTASLAVREKQSLAHMGKVQSASTIAKRVAKLTGQKRVNKI